MKTHHTHRTQVLTALLSLLWLALAWPLHAQSNFVWLTSSGTNSWASQPNWSGGILPTTTNDTADFSTLDILADTGVSLDANQSINRLSFGDSDTNSAGSWLVSTGSLAGATLTLGGATPKITVGPLGTGKFVQFNTVLTGGAGLTKLGSGNLKLAAGNTYTGLTAVGEGRLDFNSAAAWGQGAVLITNSGTMSVGEGANRNVASLTFDGSGGTFIQTLRVSGSQAMTITSFTNNSGSVATLTCNARNSLGGSGGFCSGGGILNMSVPGSAAGLPDTRFYFNGNWSAYTGTINLTGIAANSGLILQANGGSFNGNLGNASVNLTASGANTVNLLGRFFTSGTISIGELSGNTASVLGLASSSGGSATWIIGGKGTDSVFNGRITGGGINKVGAGTLTLGGNSTTTGSFLVSTGSLVGVTSGSISNCPSLTVNSNATLGVQVSAAAGRWTAGSNVTFNAGSALVITYAPGTLTTTTAPLNVLSNLTLNSPVNLTLNLQGAVWSVAQYPLLRYAGTLGGGGLAALNLTSLPNLVSGYLSNNTAAGTIDLVVTNTGYPFVWATGNGVWDTTTSNWVDQALAPTAYTEPNGLGYPVLFEQTQSSGNPIVTLNSSLVPASVQVNASRNYTFSGSGGIAGFGSLTKTGAGTLTLGTTNTFSGGLSLNGGTTAFSALENLGAGPITFGGGGLQFASGNTADISARTVTVGAGGATLDTGGNDVTFAAAIGNNGTGSLAKTGAGKLTLSGINTYKGNTLVTQGSLALGAAGAVSNSPAIVVSGGATLDATAGGLTLSATANPILAGTGTVLGSSLSLATGGTLSPGTNGVAGTLTFGTSYDASLSLDGGTLVMDVSTSTKDLIKVNGGLYMNSGAVQLLIPGTLTNGSYRLIEYDFLYGGDVANLGAVLGFSQPGQVAFLTSDFDLVNNVNFVALIVTAASSTSLVWEGDDISNLWDINSSLNWLNGVTPSVFNYGDVANFTDTGSTNPDVNLQGTILAGGVNVNSTNNYRLAGSGKLSGSSGLTKSGTGTLTLLTPNNNLGATVISAGALQVGDGVTLNAKIGPGNITNDAALVFNQLESFVLDSTVSGSGSLEHAGSQTLTLGKDNSYAGPTTIASGTLLVGSGGATGTLGSGPVTNNGALVINRSGTLAINGAISGTGGLSKGGSSTLTLGGANTYQNNTVISNGVLKLGASEVIPHGGATTGWLILDGGASEAGTLDLNGANETVNALAGTSGTVRGRIVNNGGSGTNTLTTFAAANTTYAGFIQDNTGSGGKVALAVKDPGLLTLTGSNSFSGGTLIDGSQINLGGVGQTAMGTGLVTLTNGAALVMNFHDSAANDQGTFVNPIWVPAGATGTVYALGRGNYSGNVTVNGTLNLFTSYIRSTPAGDWSASDGEINISGASSGNDVYLNTTVSKSFGTALINLQGVDFFNSANNSGPITFTIGALSGNSSSSIADTTAAGGADRTHIYQVGGRNSDATFSGRIYQLNRLVAIDKVGSGVWTLDGTNTYFGNTTVSAGTLRLGTDLSTQFGSISNSAAITVASNATFDVSPVSPWSLQPAQTLAGFGSVTGAVQTLAGATLRPGGVAAAGTLTLKNTLVANNANLVFDIANVNTEGAGTNDLLVVAGNLTLTGTNLVNFNFLNGTPALGAPYTLMTYGGITGGTANLASANSHMNVSFSTAGGKVTVTFVSIGIDLTWRGDGVTNAWQSGVVSNWFNGAALDVFFSNDKVLFDDTATNYAVDLTQSVAPASMRVNTTSNYVISGAGNISGSTSLLKQGAGSLKLATANSYLGGTTNTGGGTIDITNVFGALGTGPLVMSGATLQASVASSSATLANAIQLNAGTTNTFQAIGAGLQIIGGALSGSGKAVVQSDQGSKGFDLSGSNAAFAGIIELATPITMRLQGTNAGSAAALWDLGSSSSTLGAIASTERTLPLGALQGANGTLSGHLSSGTGTNLIWQIGALGLNTLFAGAVTDGVQTGGPNNTALDKVGVGTLTLSGNATHTGPTAINGGKLQVDGTWASSPITVIAGSLGGNGTMGSVVNVQAGGTLDPGASIGKLTVNNTLSLAGNTVIEVNKTTATNDQVVATAVNYGGTLTVIGTGTFVAGDSYPVFTAGTPNNNFAGILGSPGAGLTWSFDPTNGVLTVVGPASPTLNYSRAGNVIAFSWTGSYKLQSQTNTLSGGLKNGNTNWFDYPGGGTSPVSVTNNPANPAVFFRLVSP